MDGLTPEFFNVLIIANIIIGLALVSVRFYHDMTRKPRPSSRSRSTSAPLVSVHEGDTKPNAVVSEKNDANQNF